MMAFRGGAVSTKAAIFKQLIADEFGVVSDEILTRSIHDTFPSSMMFASSARDLLMRHLKVYESYSRNAILAALVVSQKGGAARK